MRVMTEDLQAVVAGSKGFVEAVDAQLRLRLGAPAAPACDAAALLRACAQPRSLVVVECAGPDWLAAVEQLRGARDRATLAIVAAVPASRPEALAALQRAGVDEVVRSGARVDPVVWAVDRVLAARAARAAAAPGRAPPVAGFTIREIGEPATATPGAPPVAAAVPAQAASAALAVVTVPPAAAAAPAANVVAAAAPAAPPLPDELPDDAAVRALLEDAVQGVPCFDPGLRAITDQVAAVLTPLERAALQGGELPCDPAPLVSAAVLRWRVAAVLAMARAPGRALDEQAASALPPAIDRALQALAEAGAGLGPEQIAAVNAVRNALVRDALGVTDALVRRVAPAATAPAPGPQGPATRLLSMEKADAEPPPPPRARRGMTALLVLAALLTAGYHAFSWSQRPAPPAPRRLGGAPEGMALQGPPASPLRLLVAEPGQAIDPAQLERFRKEQELQGHVVQQLSPQVVVVQPAPPPAPPPASP
jgi:hypothetical protein